MNNLPCAWEMLGLNFGVNAAARAQAPKQNSPAGSLPMQAALGSHGEAGGTAAELAWVQDGTLKAALGMRDINHFMMDFPICIKQGVIFILFY